MKNIIRCCNCGAEYLPSEIFLPDAFLGRVKMVDKDCNGKIVDIIGNNMNLYETYRCDYCNKKFSIKADIKFFTDSKVKGFESTYSTKVNKPNLFLEEK